MWVSAGLIGIFRGIWSAQPLKLYLRHVKWFFELPSHAVQNLIFIAPRLRDLVCAFRRWDNACNVAFVTIQSVVLIPGTWNNHASKLAFMFCGGWTAQSDIKQSFCLFSWAFKFNDAYHWLIIYQVLFFVNRKGF